MPKKSKTGKGKLPERKFKHKPAKHVQIQIIRAQKQNEIQ